MLTHEQEKELVIKAQAGDRSAIDALLNAYRPFINRYARTARADQIEDLAAQLSLSFIEHLPKFEVEKGFRLTTYMRWWMRQEARNFNHTNHAAYVIRHGSPMANRSALVARVKRDLGIENMQGHEDYIRVAEKTKFTIEQVAEADTWGNPRFVRLDHPRAANSDDAEGMEIQMADDEVDHLGNMDLEKRRQAIKAVLATFKERERRILMERWMVTSDEDVKTLEELGDIYGVSRERIRQIEKTAMKKLAKAVNLHHGQLLEAGHVADIPERNAKAAA